MRKKLFWTYRNLILEQFPMWDTIYQGWYWVELFNSWLFKSYELANITKTILPIPEERYNKTIPIIDDNEVETWEKLRKWTLLFYIEYSDLYTTEEELKNSLLECSAVNRIRTFNNIEEIKTWIRESTDLIEEEDWKFLIKEASEFQEAKYLIIE